MKPAITPLPPPSPILRSGQKAVNAIAKSPHRHNVISSIAHGQGEGVEHAFNAAASDAVVAATIQSINHGGSHSSSSNNPDLLVLKSHALLQEILGDGTDGNSKPDNEKNSYKRRQFEARKELLYLNSILDEMMVDLRKDLCNQMGAKWQPTVVNGDDDLDVNSLAVNEGDSDNIVTLLSLQGVKKAKRLKSNYLHHFEYTQKLAIEKSKLLAEELEVTRQKLRDSELERSSYAAIIGKSTEPDELEIESFNRQLKFDGSAPSAQHRNESLVSVIERLLQSMVQDTSVQARQAMRSIRENKLSSSDGADAVCTIIDGGSKKLQDLALSLAMQLDRERKAASANIESLSKELLGTQVLIADLTEKSLEYSKRLQEKDITAAKNIRFIPDK